MEVGDDNEEIKKAATLNARPRTKKKSTLAKLKERQHKELGSITSLKKANLGSTASLTKDETNLKTVTSNNYESKRAANLYSTDDEQVVDLDSYKFSTKDPPEEQIRRPRPQPRGRRQSSDVSAENVHMKNQPITGNEDLSNRKQDNSDGTPIQMLRNLKMDGDQTDVVEAAINPSSFVPKPPSTPRKPRSNPRTPRGFILAGKGEKRTREPWSSGEEPEVEEKKEKSNRINDMLNSSDTAEVVDISDFGNATEHLSTNETVNGNTAASSLSYQPPGRPLYKERLKRSSKDANSENGSHGDLHNMAPPNLDRPPMDYRSKGPEQLNQNTVSSMSQSGINFEKIGPISTNTNGNNGGSSNDNMPDSALQVHTHHLLTHTTSDSQPTKGLHTSESPEKMSLVSSPPRTARLDPITPKSHPPPLPEELSSRSLRTMYKIDPDVYQRTSMGQFAAGTNKSDAGANSNGDRLSQRSFSSVSVLPIITTKEARSRHGCEGSVMGSMPCTLGTEEVDRYFPERKVNIFVGTWNMNELKDVASSLDDFILPEKCDYVHDIYAIGTQENNMNKKEWEVKVQQTLGPSHVMLHSISLGSLHLAVFIRRDLIWFCSVPEDDIISLRAVTIVKTKGAVGICFTLFGTSYLFINCHLTSDRNNETSRKKNRLEDYCKVISEMKLPKSAENSSTTQKPTDVTAIFDCIFWFGDLNFRIERKRQVVQRKVNQIATEEFPNFETLLEGDQLLNYMTEGKIFGGFLEGRINFHPTFKFDVDTDTYDSSTKNRVPSYTDRIMFRSKKKHDIACMQYDAVLNIKLSDHRPVYGVYESAIKPARDNLVFSAGHFDKSVYTEAIRRQTAIPAVRKRQSAVCVVQ